ncbi:hypothetical protein [uncultured Brevundimonas sp.]|uniref:hypothetical protein n=1 Tax=uncultured Brevundimonas sp. TaxID=213418 RepID=UPI002635194C|nr:hypothetical protein [uncultured Brevundimonas sp.]
MSVSSLNGSIGNVASVGLALSTGKYQPTSSIQGDLDQIREKGFSVWAHDQQMEKLKERLRAEVLSDKKMSESDVAAMPAEHQATVEDEIAKLVAQKLQEAMKAKVQEAAETGKTTAVLVDISV